MFSFCPAVVEWSADSPFRPHEELGRFFVRQFDCKTAVTSRSHMMTLLAEATPLYVAIPFVC